MAPLTAYSPGARGDEPGALPALAAGRLPQPWRVRAEAAAIASWAAGRGREAARGDAMEAWEAAQRQRGALDAGGRAVALDTGRRRRLEHAPPPRLHLEGAPGAGPETRATLFAAAAPLAVLLGSRYETADAVALEAPPGVSRQDAECWLRLEALEARAERIRLAIDLHGLRPEPAHRRRVADAAGVPRAHRLGLAAAACGACPAAAPFVHASLLADAAEVKAEALEAAAAASGPPPPQLQALLDAYARAVRAHDPFVVLVACAGGEVVAALLRDCEELSAFAAGHPDAAGACLLSRPRHEHSFMSVPPARRCGRPVCSAGLLHAAAPPDDAWADHEDPCTREHREDVSCAVDVMLREEFAPAARRRLCEPGVDGRATRELMCRWYWASVRARRTEMGAVLEEAANRPPLACARACGTAYCSRACAAADWAAHAPACCAG